MDQVITLIDQYLSPVIQSEKHSLLTSSMVNNYVKKGMIPPPEKKRYNQKHLAFLIAITMLKQVLTIPEIKTGILFQGKVVGIRNAYNLFCEEQEKAIWTVCQEAAGSKEAVSTDPIPVELIAIKGATRSFANKLLAENTIELERTKENPMNKEKIALLVDSGTDVPAEIMSQYGMYMLPLQIIYKDRTYTDKVDITAEEIYQRLPQEIPSTSLPDGETINKIFDRIKADGYEQVLAVTISSGLSGTYNVVRLMGEQRNDLDIFVLDTKNIGIGAGLQAIRAAELLNEGVTWQELKEQLLQEVVRNKVFFNVATLEYLQKGGRIGLVASILGNALKLNPIISCNDEGIYYTVAKSRGRKKSLDKTVELVKQYIGNHKQFRLAVAQGDALAEAKEMKTRLEQEFPQVKEIFFGQISPALVVHTGPGLLGVGVQLLDETGI